MKKINEGTQAYRRAWYTWTHCNYGSIEQAYKSCSQAKINSYNDIWRRAMDDSGYNHDLRVVARGSSFYSTMYSVDRVDEQGNTFTRVIYDTYANTYYFDYYEF